MSDMNTPSIEVIADILNEEVEMILESDELDVPVRMVLTPQTARDLAFTLTKASFVAEVGAP